MFAFVSHESACEALRSLSAGGSDLSRVPRWPEGARRLPLSGSCVTNQRGFKALCARADLEALGLASVPVDLLVPRQEMRSSGKRARFHVWGAELPPSSFLRLGDCMLVSSPELVIVQLCASQGHLEPLLDAHAEAVRAENDLIAEFDLDEEPVLDHPLEWERIRRLVAATVIACEFAGTYRLTPDGGACYGAPCLMSLDSLSRAIAEVGDTQGTRRACRVRDLAFDRSASPMETAVALMLSLPVDMGGFGLTKPVMNCAIDVSEWHGTLSERSTVMPDLLWPAQRVAVEYDSAAFHASSDEGQLWRDAVRSNALVAMGYKVFRATPRTAGSLSGLSILARQLSCALGVDLAIPAPLQELRRRKLFSTLMPKVRG